MEQSEKKLSLPGRLLERLQKLAGDIRIDILYLYDICVNKLHGNRSVGKPYRLPPIIGGIKKKG
ncbi:MAG: hypothetical protein V1936_01735 [Patescibacteria group bacterium]